MAGMFKLREPIVAVRTPSSESLTIFTVPRGAIIKVMGEPQKSGLVEAVWDERRIAVFIQDVQSRGESVEAASTSA